MKKMTRFLALALSAAVAAGSLVPAIAEAASNTISRVGNKERSVYVGKEFELSVKKNGNFSDNKIYWTIGDTSIVKFDDDDRYDNDIDLKAVKAGTTKVTAKNLITGGKIVYNITVKKAANNYYIERVGSASRTIEVDDDAELRVNKGPSLDASQIVWSIADTSIVRFDEGRNTGTEVEVEGIRTGTTKVTAHNLHTGGKLVFTITVVPEYDD